MPSPDQLAELQNPEILKAFFAETKTSEIQSRLDEIKALRSNLPEESEASRKLQAIAQLRKLSSC